MRIPRHAILSAVVCLAPASALATQAKIDTETCNSLRLEQIKFRQSGVIDDMSKGAAWAKANLSAERLREIEHYLQLDEQVKFGCRDAKLSPAAERASEAAARIEANSDADPTAPVGNDPPKPGAAKADAKPAAKKSVHKKTKPSDPKASGDKSSAITTKSKPKVLDADAAPHPPVVVEPQAPSETANASDAAARGKGEASSETPTLPAFGFGEMSVSPPSAP